MNGLKIFLFVSLFFSLAFTSCENKGNNIVIAQEITGEGLEMDSNATEFLSLFKTIDPTGLHIYSSISDEDGNLIDGQFEGVPIDVKKFAQVNDETIFVNLTACKQGYSNIYAIAKFEINTRFLGLLVRQQSQYDETLVQLLLMDKRTGKVEKGIDMADSFGDAGWFFSLESWIVNFKFDTTLEIVSRRKDLIPKANFVDYNDMDSITTDTLKISRLVNSVFITQPRNQSDTIKFKLKNWR